MTSYSESTISAPDIKQEKSDLQRVSQGRKKAAKKGKKRNLVRWDDALDKQVLLTLQWACNEVGIKIPWELVAQTIGNGVSEGAIVQHLSKLRGKMVVAKMAVPPGLRRGIVAKEPSKLYGTSNGKKLPPPVFAAPTTSVETKPKQRAISKSQSTPKAKPTTKSKAKRRRSEVDDSDEEVFNDFVEDSDEEYGTTKKRVRTSKLKAKETKVSTTGKSATKKPAASKAELDDADVDDINEAILASLEDGGPASRTRHVKQDFTKLDANYTDEEEDEDDGEEEEEDYAEGGFGDFKASTKFVSTTLKQERSVSPRTMAPRSKVDVASWNQGVPSTMRSFGGNTGAQGNIGVSAHQRATISGRTGMMTPLPSRHASSASYNTSMLETPILGAPLRSNFGEGAGYGVSNTDYGPNFNEAGELLTGSEYDGADNHLSPLDDDLGLGIGYGGLPAELDDGFGYPMTDDSIFDQYTY